MKLTDTQFETIKNIFFEEIEPISDARLDGAFKHELRKVEGDRKRAIAIMASRFALRPKARVYLESIEPQGVNYQHYMTGFKKIIKEYFKYTN